VLLGLPPEKEPASRSQFLSLTALATKLGRRGGGTDEVNFAAWGLLPWVVVNAMELGEIVLVNRIPGGSTVSWVTGMMRPFPRDGMTEMNVPST